MQGGGVAAAAVALHLALLLSVVRGVVGLRRVRPRPCRGLRRGPVDVHRRGPRRVRSRRGMPGPLLRRTRLVGARRGVPWLVLLRRVLLRVSDHCVGAPRTLR